MKCSDVRVELSARMDGEAPDQDAQVDAHLERCSSCRQWLKAAEEVTRRARISVAAVPVDVVAPVLTGAGFTRPRGRTRRWLVRGCLAVIGVVQLALTLTPLLRYPRELHVLHEVGAWDLAFGVALLTAAARPRRAGGLVPLVAALLASLVTLTAPDVLADRATLADERAHLVIAVSLVLLWLLDRSVGRPTDPLSRLPYSSPNQPDAAGSALIEGAHVRTFPPRSGRITGAA